MYRVALEKEYMARKLDMDKGAIISEYGLSKGDTGSPEVQIALHSENSAAYAAPERAFF